MDAKQTAGPAIITCGRCGHCATTRARGFPALGVAELAGKTLVCTSCGQRQRADLAQIADADAVRPKRKHAQDRPLRVQESQATTEIAEPEIATPKPKPTPKPKKGVADDRGERRMLH